MNHLLGVCLVALTLVTGIAPSVAAQSPENSFARTWKGYEATPATAQAMRKGISVELPVTSNAAPMPDADQEDASIVSVTEDGTVYFGVEQISPAGLAETVKGGLSNRTEKKLYIKADARTPYANVMNVLDAVRTAGVEALKLLTAQRDSSEPGTLVPPKGLEVLVGPPSGSAVTVVEVLNSGQRWPTLKINNQNIPWATLQSSLRQLFQNRSEKVVLVKAAGTLPFANVVDVTDMCRSTGAKVVLVTPGL
jgi:biopolymer transport protein ExbD